MQTEFSFFSLKIGMHHLESQPLQSMSIPIPTTDCPNPTVLWPLYDGGNCYCLPLDRRGYRFNECARQCQSDFDITYEIPGNRSISINHLRGNSNFMMHFICEHYPCHDQSCLIHTVVASYRITVEGKSPNNYMS